MDNFKKILTAFELHSVEGIKEAFEHGVDPNSIVNGKPLIYGLINMYLRGPKFKDCVRVFADHGVDFEDPVFFSVLLDDAVLLDSQLTEKPGALEKKFSLDGTFTPLHEVSLLHICAEYNHLSCARILLKHGADVNAKAGVDENGFGGQTPIFHTVNQHANVCKDMMQFLIANDADLSFTVSGLIWGKGYDWETFIPSVNPISYAMMGLLRQFQRTEKDIYENVSILMKERYGINFSPRNIPNKYLEK